MTHLLDFVLHKIFSLINKLRSSDYNGELLFKGDVTKLPPISVVIPVIEKDLEILKFNIINLVEFCQNPIEKIYVVAPDREKIKAVCVELGVTWINEIEVAPVSKDTIHKLLGESFRVNWFYQQFMKLNLDQIIPAKYYLILDADTVLLSKQYFVSNEHMILKVSDEFHFLYQITNKKLLNNFSFGFKSFISHHQLIDRDILIDLKRKITKGDEQSFWTRILSDTKSNANWFSEYELYGNFANQFYKNQVRIVYWFNKNLYRRHFEEADTDSISKKYASVSFHNYQYRSIEKTAD